jgi:hypothetical protein
VVPHFGPLLVKKEQGSGLHLDFVGVVRPSGFKR